MEAFAAQKAELERVAAEKLADSQRRAEKLEGCSVTISQKAGVDGRLFGSITNADIADALKAQGHEVAKSEIRLPEGPFKTLGEYPVVLALHADITANITVVVTGRTVTPPGRSKKGSPGSLFYVCPQGIPGCTRFIHSLIPLCGGGGRLESGHGRYPLV